MRLETFGPRERRWFPAAIAWDDRRPPLWTLGQLEDGSNWIVACGARGLHLACELAAEQWRLQCVARPFPTPAVARKALAAIPDELCPLSAWRALGFRAW